MKCYAMMYDPEENRFFCEESYYNISHSPQSNIATTGYTDTYFTKEFILGRIENNNLLLKYDEIRVYRCKDCERYFVLNKSEIEWFSDAGLSIPKRCKECRKQRKEHKR